jgi:hypothetical protein
MATDKHAMDNRATVEAFFCGLSQGNNGAAVFSAVCFVEVFSLWSVHGLYNQGHQPTKM